MKAVLTLFRVWAKLEDGILIALLTAMIVLAFLQIVLRNFFSSGVIWIEPLVRQMLLWLTLAGAMIATREDRHITVDAISRFLKGRAKLAAELFCNLFALLVCALLTYSTFLVFSYELQAPQGGDIVRGLPLYWSLATLPCAFGVMSLRFARRTGAAAVGVVRGRDARPPENRP